MSFQSRTIRRRYARTSKRLSTSRFSPCARGIAASKGRMGASNGARSTYSCRSRRDSGRVADGSANLPRHPFAPSQKNGEWQTPQHEVVYLVSSLPAAASRQALLGVNRDHWRIEIMHRNKDVILGEDDYTNRCDNAPRKHFSLTGFVLKILKSVAPSPTRAIEHFQDDRNRAIRLFSAF